MRSLLLLAILLLPAQAFAAEEDAPSFVAFPIETGLQQKLLQTTEADIYLEIDGDPISADKIVRPEYVLGAQVQARLRKIVHDQMLTFPRVYVKVSVTEYFYVRKLTQQMKKRFAETSFEPKLRLKGTVLEGGGTRFADKPDFTLPNQPAKTIADLRLAGDGFEAFRVTSPLARRLTYGADIFVILDEPITRDFQAFPPNVVAELKEIVDELAPQAHESLLLRCQTTRDGQKTVEEFCSRKWDPIDPFGAPLPSPADQFAAQLGFKQCRVETRTMGIALEDLLGKKAPNFQLQNQDEQEVDLHEFAQGNVIVLNFSGIACAPCQHEAPHLTALQKQFAGQGVKVISVNGYNESPEAIRQNIKQLSLEHPIVAMGKEVAQKQYTVTSYPMTFFLDRQGVIRDYHHGFDKGDEVTLQRKVKKLLEH
ncbi:TlpA family protein disulfide reductase [Bremerella cremea]|uniref:TlpA family protein disulfide reductase n=1 Tax=Bremerella cremea TaxID=1031537 RepID=A0A368KTT4_9BACT|nr:TlpA disulfide reductase family protein [Bremerella cremea]RCS52988.1 TlpA family protein disulfide reductase [Bremerella cremea]